MSRGIGYSLKRIGISLVAFVLAIGLCPLQAFASQETQSQGDAKTAASAENAEYALVAQVEEDGTCIPGQALVVYHASGAAKGSTGTLEIQSNSDPLSDAGFDASSIWDLSTADSLAESTGALEDGALSVQSEATGSTIASGSDVRVALVERGDMSVADLVASLESLDFVECASPNYSFKSESLTEDTYADLQWGLSGADSAVDGSTSGIDYAAALEKDTAAATTEDSVVVAVLDTGVDYTNPDLADQMWTDPGDIGLGYQGSHGYNGWANTYDPMASEIAKASHGTHCAGIVAAQSKNAAGVASAAGANAHTQIMGLRQESDDGYIIGSAIVSCYDYLVRAQATGVNVVAVNCSWGSFEAPYDPVLDYLINQAGKAGVLSVFAAGNDSGDDQYDYSCTMLESPYLIDVASSNQNGALSIFTCYNATAVDIAAPGSKILSTFPNYCGDTSFLPLLSHKAGKTATADGMFYYTDIASLGTSGITCTLFDTSKSETFTCDGAVMLSATGNSLFGSNALKVSIDNDKIAAADHNPTDVRVNLSWSMTNPFKGAALEDTDPSHYGVGVALDVTGLTGMQRVKAYEGLYSGSTNLVAKDSEGYQPCATAIEDANWLNSGTLSSIDTTSDTLTAQMSIACDNRRYSSDDPIVQPSGTWSCLVTGYGIGRITNPTEDTEDTAIKSAYVPYFFDSGTSMAAPMIAGSIGELAALNPNYTPLQLRGLVCGGTDPLTGETYDSAGIEMHIASDGRFTFGDALDNAKVNANTWSITTSGTSVTVHGYNLEDAALYVDDTAHATPVTPTSQEAGAITFTASSSLFDGQVHRFDVVDGTTGRAYNAS